MITRWSFVIILGLVSIFTWADSSANFHNLATIPLNKMIRATNTERLIAYQDYREKMSQYQVEDAQSGDEERAYETVVTIPKKGAVAANRAPASIGPNFGGIVKDMRILLIPRKQK